MWVLISFSHLFRLRIAPAERLISRHYLQTRKRRTSHLFKNVRPYPSPTSFPEHGGGMAKSNRTKENKTYIGDAGIKRDGYFTMVTDGRLHADQGSGQREPVGNMPPREWEQSGFDWLNLHEGRSDSRHQNKRQTAEGDWLTRFQE